MSAELEELTQYIRQTLPQSKHIVNLQKNEGAGVVTFTWQGREFVVRPTREVFEVRGKNLYITGSSMLLHSVLLKRDTHQKVVETVLDVLVQAEDMIAGRRQTEAGLRLVDQVKGTLAKLAGKPSS